MVKILIIDQDGRNVYERQIKTLEKAGYKVDLAITVNAVESYYSKTQEGLGHYDVIFLDPLMDPGPFSLEETDDGTHTGWPLYKKWMINLKMPIVVLAQDVKDYTYPTTEHSSRKWGDNVILKERNSEDDLLLNIVEEIK